MKTGSALVADGTISQKLFKALDPISDFLLRLNDLDVKRNMPCALRVIEQ